MKSDHGCTVAVTAYFKQDFVPLKSNMANKSQMVDGVERSTMTSPRANQSQIKSADPNAEEDFSTWTLGNGKMSDKVAILQTWLSRL